MSDPKTAASSTTGGDMARKTQPRKDGFPTYEELEHNMLEIRHAIDKELVQLLGRDERILEAIRSRRTRSGKPLTKRGLNRLLSDLRGIHYRQAGLMQDDMAVCRRQSITTLSEIYLRSHEGGA